MKDYRKLIGRKVRVPIYNDFLEPDTIDTYIAEIVLTKSTTKYRCPINHAGELGYFHPSELQFID